MVSTNAIPQVNLSNVSSVKQADIQKLIKYVNNETLKDVPDTFTSRAKDAASSAALFEGIPLISFLLKNKKLNGNFVNEGMKTVGDANKKALENLIKGKGSLGQRIVNYVADTNMTKRAYNDVQSIVKSQFKADKLAKKAAKKAAKATTEHAQKAAAKAATKAEAASVKAAEKAAVNIGEKVADAGVKSSGKISKFLKNSSAGIMLVFSGIAECVTEVIPTFKELGKEKGYKQIGKSAVKVAGDTVGFIAGEQAGVAIGTAIGTAICPGIGSAIGAVCGFVGGMLGSFAMGKVTKAITGPSERELAKEEQQKTETEEIMNDDDSLEMLKNEVLSKIQEDAADGELTEDSKAVMEILENLEDSNPFAK